MQLPLDPNEVAAARSLAVDLQSIGVIEGLDILNDAQLCAVLREFEALGTGAGLMAITDPEAFYAATHDLMKQAVTNALPPLSGVAASDQTAADPGEAH